MFGAFNGYREPRRPRTAHRPAYRHRENRRSRPARTKKMHLRAYTSEHSGYRGRGMPKTESPPPAGAKGRGFAGAGCKRKTHRPEGSDRCLASIGARPQITNGGGFDHNPRRDGQNAHHSQIPFQRSSLETLLSASKDGSLPQNPRWARFQKQELLIGRAWRRQTEHWGARKIANGGRFDHFFAYRGQNARHSQTPPSQNLLNATSI